MGLIDTGTERSNRSRLDMVSIMISKSCNAFAIVDFSLWWIVMFAWKRFAVKTSAVLFAHVGTGVGGFRVSKSEQLAAQLFHLFRNHGLDLLRPLMLHVNGRIGRRRRRMIMFVAAAVLVAAVIQHQLLLHGVPHKRLDIIFHSTEKRNTSTSQ